MARVKKMRPSSPTCVNKALGRERLGSAVEGSTWLPWQVAMRILATLANTTMVLYVYFAHLAGLEWQDFGRSRAAELGHSRSIRDYLLELDPAFEHLRMFTFSEAMLENLQLYLIIGGPVAAIVLSLERNRVRWLRSLSAESLPQQQAQRCVGLLERYFQLLCVTFVFILLIAPFHLGMPRMHYSVAMMAILCGFGSIQIYLVATTDLAAITNSTNDEVVAWVSAQQWVRPVLKFVLILHGAALAAAVWKAESLGDDWPSLVFGVFETLLVLGYQLFQGVFVLDDLMKMRGSARPLIVEKNEQIGL